MKRVLITGAAGFIGFHLARKMAERGDEVLGLDCINDYYDENLKFARLAELGIGEGARDPGREVQSSRFPGLSFVRAGIEDRRSMEGVFSHRSFDVVCNLAAQAGVRYSIENPRSYVESNVVGFLELLECCRAAATPHLVFASSSSVYGLDATRPFSPHSGAEHPASVYAATKKADEMLAHAYSHLFRIPVTGLRFFTVYGPWGRPDMAYYKFSEAILEGRPIDVNNGGDMYRDFTYIDDIVEGILRVADRPPSADPSWDPSRPDPASSSAPYRIYNIGNNRPVRLGDFVAELEKLLGARATKRYPPMPAGDVYATEADVSDLERDFGWAPSTPLGEGLDRFVSWFREYRGEAGKAR